MNRYPVQFHLLRTLRGTETAAARLTAVFSQHGDMMAEAKQFPIKARKVSNSQGSAVQSHEMLRPSSDGHQEKDLSSRQKAFEADLRKERP